MNLYLIERHDEIGYDEYDSAVVAAEAEPAAWAKVNWALKCTPPATCKMVGVAVAGIEAGIICASFNAG